MTDSEPVKRRGRPRVPDEKRKGTLTFRLRADLRERIEARAKQTGKTISEEVEFLLDQSLDPDGYVQRKLETDLKPFMALHLGNMIKDVAVQMTANEVLSITREIKNDILEEIKLMPYKFSTLTGEEDGAQDAKLKDMIDWRVAKYIDGLKLK